MKFPSIFIYHITFASFDNTNPLITKHGMLNIRGESTAIEVFNMESKQFELYAGINSLWRWVNLAKIRAKPNSMHNIHNKLRIFSKHFVQYADLMIEKELKHSTTKELNHLSLLDIKEIYIPSIDAFLFGQRNAINIEIKLSLFIAMV